MLRLLVAALATVFLAGCEAAYPPTHQESAIPKEPLAAVPNPVVWIWSGGLEPRAIRVRARTLEPADSAIWVVTREDDPDRSRDLRVDAARDGLLLAGELLGLEPGSRYRIEVEVDGVVDPVRAARFRTPAEGPQSFRVALGSCASTGSNGRVFDTIRGLDPLFFLHLGDFHYENLASRDPDDYRHAFDRVLDSAAQARLYRSVPVEYVWDDHDFGGNNSDSTHAGRDAVARVYRERVPHRPLAVAEPTGPIQRAFTIGRVRFVVTDARGERDPREDPDTASKTMLGAEQKGWWKRQVEGAAAAGQVVVWVSSVPWIAEASEGADSWGGYSHEREELAAFLEALLDDERLPGLVMLSGDAHMLAYDDGSNNTFGPSERPLFPVLHAAALDRRGSIKGGPYTEGPFPGGGQLGLFEVEDDGGGTLVVRLIGRTWDGVDLFAREHRFAMPLAAGSGSEAETPAGSAVGPRRGE